MESAGELYSVNGSQTPPAPSRGSGEVVGHASGRQGVHWNTVLATALVRNWDQDEDVYENTIY
jgi:hypothetical protein